MSTPDDTPKPQPQLQRTQLKSTGAEVICGIERGMVFWGAVEERESRDSEHFHPKDNPCPWVVLSSDQIHRRLPLVLAAPLTSKLNKDQNANLRQHRIRIPEAHLIKYSLPLGNAGITGDSLVLTEQIRVMAHCRLIGNPIAKATVLGLASIEAGVKHVLDLL